MKTKNILLSIMVLGLIFFIGCKSETVQPPQYQITKLNTNGTFVATNHTQIQGTMFITDQDNKPVNGVSSSNVTASLRWGSMSPTDTGVGGIVIITQHGGGSGSNVAAGLTMDYSGSMGSQQIACMQNACTTYVNSMNASDKSEIVKFASGVEVVQPFTNNKTDLNNKILSYWSGTGGSTALYQAIYQATGDVKQQPSNLIKGVIAFTDGGENNSTITRSEMINFALLNGIPVYTVGLLTTPNSTQAYDLQNIADTTGAFYFYSHPDSCTNLNNIYSTISGQLAGSYALTVNWQGTLPNPGTLVNVTITTTVSNLTSSFRRSYILP